MRKLFADTFYWAALINPRDNWHLRVRNYSNSLLGVPIVTTEEVLTEVLNFFSAYQFQMRQGAVTLVNGILQSPEITVIHQTHKSFIAGLTLYTARRDKEYSLTDCISMATMQELGLTEVLTNDKHFRQEGFSILFEG